MATELTKNTKLAWRRLLISQPGEQGLLVLRESAPRVGGVSDAHTIIFQAGVAEGFARAIDAIYDLASAEREDSSQELEPK